MNIFGVNIVEETSMYLGQTELQIGFRLYDNVVLEEQFGQVFVWRVAGFINSVQFCFRMNRIISPESM